ncbi:MAG: histidine phosphatase family protein [Clostridia bacterium]|nr:histidine phosphatase family protein [Clostridia bacterium]
MKLLIIRHGESEADILHVHEGRADFELTERGHMQAEKMAEYVSKRYNVSRLYSSTLRRAAQSAAHLAGKTGLKPIYEDKLREFDNGLLAGLKYDEAARLYPRVSLPLHTSAYEQESELEFRARAEFVLSKLLSENNETDTVAVYTHGGMINRLFQAFLRLPIDCSYLLRTGDAGLHEWEASNNLRIIIRANFTLE